jgi:hypothetical protein
MKESGCRVDQAQAGNGLRAGARGCRRAACVLAFVGALVGALLGSPTVRAQVDSIDAGRAIYQEGRLPAGGLLAGISAAGVRLEGSAAACANCHRRSGMGGNEGGRRVRSIAAPDLFGSTGIDRPRAPGDARGRGAPGIQWQAARHLARRPYDDASLESALRTGLDPDGHPLGPLMPRYTNLDIASMHALTNYLRSLQAVTAPGVGPSELRVASVVTPDSDTQRRVAVLSVIEAWAARQPGMSLEVWQLAGDPDTWGDQLRQRYRQRPVFALVAGIGAANWEPVDRFCEDLALPCILPIVDRTPVGQDAASHWSIYFAQAPGLEARVLAAYLRQSRDGMPHRVVQLFDGTAGEAAAAALAAALVGTPVAIEARPWVPGPAANAELGAWHEGDVLVAWLGAAALGQLWAALGPDRPARIYISAQLAPFERLPPPDRLREPVRVVSAYLDPIAQRGRTALGLLPWAAHVGVPITDERLQSEAFAAVSYFGDALARMQRRMDREFLLETLERVVDNRPLAGAYLSLSLGPGQRFAAKSGHILALPPNGERWLPISERIVPQGRGR